MDWDKLKVFYNVAESGSFTRAAQRLEVSQSAVSRQISGLEDMLDTPLFHRHARGLILTQQGEMLYRTTREVFSELALVEAEVRDNTDFDRGRLAITANVGFGNLWMAPLLYEFLDAHPSLHITFTLSENAVDLMAHESDVAITSRIINDADIIYKRLLTKRLRMYASREYLLTKGVPITPEHLDRHRLITFGEETSLPSANVNWILTCGTLPGVVREPYMTINNLYAIGRAAASGAGIACLPPYVAKACPELVEILPEIQGPEVTFYYAYHRQLSDSKRIQSLYTFLKEKAEAEENEEC